MKTHPGGDVAGIIHVKDEETADEPRCADDDGNGGGLKGVEVEGQGEQGEE